MSKKMPGLEFPGTQGLDLPVGFRLVGLGALIISN